MKAIAGFVIVTIVLITPLLGEASRIDEMTLALIEFIAALGLAISFGVAGQFVLCHAALIGVGAYVFGYLRLHGTSLASAAVVAVLSGALAGLVLGSIALRVRGHYFAIFTLALGVFAHEVAIRWSAVTGGAIGLSDLPTLSGIPVPRYALYLISAFTAIIAAWYLVEFQRSSFGQQLVAIRGNPLLAAASGINPITTTVLPVALSAIFAAMAGVLHVQFMQSFTPENISIERSVMLLLIVALGGRQSVLGLATATWIAEVLPNYLSIAGELRFLIIGVVILVAILVSPNGLRSLPGRLHQMAAARLWRTAA